MTTRRFARVLAPLCLFATAFAAPLSVVAAAEPNSVNVSAAAFAKLQSLAGDWSGTVVTKGTGPKAAVQYRLIGNKSTVVEALFPGTPHEMVTMYHRNGDRVVLTHFCAMGNQPEMELSPESTADELKFTFTGGDNIEPAKSTHMHSGSIRFVSADEIEMHWTVWQDGKAAGTNDFFLQRTAAPTPAPAAHPAPAKAAPAASAPAAKPSGY